MLMEEFNNLEKITIQLQDGGEVECGIVSIFPVYKLNRRFIALNPLYDTNFGSMDEIHIFSLLPVDENRYELDIIEDSVFNSVLDEFCAIVEA